jgi:hypothetical protein
MLDGLLEAATYDWVDISAFSGAAKKTGIDSPEVIRAAALGLMAEALTSDLLVPGEADQSGFHPWAGSPGDAIQRLVQEWTIDNLFPTPGEIAWFELTPKGVEAAAAARAGRQTR